METVGLLKKILIIILFIICCLDSGGQRKIARTYYKNGQPESKGFIYTYSVFYDVKLKPKFKKMGELQKKGKEWKYWYQNGELSRIENYKFIQDNNPFDLPDGTGPISMNRE